MARYVHASMVVRNGEHRWTHANRWTTDRGERQLGVTMGEIGISGDPEEVLAVLDDALTAAQIEWDKERPDA